jgi:segregation and condensation protein A
MPEVAEYKVKLDNYYGPLDLLLHLVKETEVDITAIALARACEQYIGFLSAMERRDIDLSGNFLALASQLLLIKSRTVAPPEVTPGVEGDEEEEEGDASLELIKKLLDYKRFKDRARMLDLMMTERSQKFGRPRIKLEGETEQEPLRNLELWDLVLLYSKALKGTRLDAMLSILYRDVPLEIFIDKILNTLVDKKVTSLHELLGETPDRTSILGTFLAILQLAKIQKVTVEQEVDYGDIRVASVEAPPAPLVLETAVPSETAVKENAFNNRFAPKAEAAPDATPAPAPVAAAAPAAEAAPAAADPALTDVKPVKPRRRRAPVVEAPAPELAASVEPPPIASPEQGEAPATT